MDEYILRKFDSEMREENRKALFLVDNCSAHNNCQTKTLSSGCEEHQVMQVLMSKWSLLNRALASRCHLLNRTALFKFYDDTLSYTVLI